MSDTTFRACLRTYHIPSHQPRIIHPQQQKPQIIRAFSTSPSYLAQPPTADALMTTLTDLYSTAKDEFEIAAEETEKKTVYAADDREAAKEALELLKEAFDRAVRESDPETARAVQSRVGDRIRELENALVAVEEMAMED
ncbi:hypothetical protein PMZ80_004499 [Knufia obscura]|uniref:Uncharacterized protein n=1 Tax=Knufia obscura TaxID=1635080 RepID=A0ABR0RSW7_9EURO|nr:hypothetical protein PMZ80_004499 [Knufia obscura]